MPAVILVLILIAGPASAQRTTSPILEDILRRNEEAMGGRVALDGVQSVWRQRNAHTFTLRQKPDKHVVVLLDSAGSVRYAEGFDGTDAWEIVDDGPKRPVSQRARTALWHVTQFPSELRPLARLRDSGHSLSMLGRSRIGGLEYFEILVRLSDGFERTYYVHPQTYQIERSRDVRRHHAYEEQQQPIEGTWSDFRQVESLVLPFTTGERNYETGERLSGGTMVQIRLDVLMPEAVFSPTGSLQPFLDYLRKEAR